MKTNSFIKNRKAFTLSEILLVLGIISVIGVMTIPPLIQNSQEKMTVAALKKVFSTLSSAYTLAVQENGTPENWGLVVGSHPEGDAPIINMLKPYLNVSKDCSDGSTGCFPPGIMYKYLRSSDIILIDTYSVPKLKLSDGTLLFGFTQSTNCTGIEGTSLALQNICGRYFVDINGYKNPNQYGKDVFRFYLTKYGVIPYGSAQENGSSSFVNDCKNKDTTNGFGCAAWVIYNENMDYLHCSNLSWDGPTKCQ